MHSHKYIMFVTVHTLITQFVSAYSNGFHFVNELLHDTLTVFIFT